MPPFAGTAEEVEALVQFLVWNHAEHPDSQHMTTASDDFKDTLARIQAYLDEAGTEPAEAHVRSQALQDRANQRWTLR